MKKFITILLLIISLALSAGNPPVGNAMLIGKTTDINTNELLAGVKIQIEGIETQFYSDLDGKFNITLPPGTYNVKFSMISYNASYIENLELNAQNIDSLNMKLK